MTGGGGGGEEYCLLDEPAVPLDVRDEVEGISLAGAAAAEGRNQSQRCTGAQALRAAGGVRTSFWFGSSIEMKPWALKLLCAARIDSLFEMAWPRS